MTAGIIIYGTEGNFELAHKSWDFIKIFESDIIFSIKSIDFTSYKLKDKFPNSKLYECTEQFENDSELNLHLLKKGYSLLKKNYDYVIIMKINSFIVNKNGYEFLLNCKNNDCICGYRPIKIVGKNSFYVPDNFFIGNQKNIGKLIENLPNTVETELSDIIPRTLLENDLYVKDIGPYFNIEEVFNNILPNQINLSLHELKSKAIEWKSKK